MHSNHPRHRGLQLCRFTGAVASFLIGALFLPADRGYASDPLAEINFVNDVVPVLTKAGCNSGLCHAKSGGGQNGFELSLFGFEPLEDFDHLVREGRGRRLFPAAPEQSLLLKKASGQLPHGGGVRLAVNSGGYKLLREWIRQGTPLSNDADPTLESIEVQPQRGSVAAGGHQQLKAIAHYSDGSTRDITE